MPVQAATPRDHFLATMATVLQRGAVQDAAAVDVVAQEAARDVAAEHPGISSDELLAALPDAWRRDPTGSTTRSTTNAFLQAAPILGVQTQRLSPLATRLMQVGADATFASKLDQAQRAGALPSAALSAPIDLLAPNGRDLRAALDAAFADPAFQAFNALPRQRGAPQGVVDEFVHALWMTLADVDTMPSVSAGGVEVSGPSVKRAYDARLHGTFRALPPETTAGALAQVLVELAAVRDELGEGIRAALDGAQFLSGHAPPPATMPLHVAATEDGKLGVGFGIDVAQLRKFHDVPGVADEEVALRAGKALRAQDAELRRFKDAGVPLGLWTDPRARESAVVQARLTPAAG